MTILKRHYAFVAFLLCCATAAAAQDVPLPAALMTAKTAIVVNAGVTQDVYERLILELRDWKRFTLVTDPAQADLTIAIDGQNTIGTVVATNRAFPVRAIAYTLSFKQGETVLYRDALKGCCSLKAMTRKTLEKLDKRMRQETR